ncbi:MAG: acetyl-CoA C-acyltransferase [Sandaracinus sp.]|nr:acetyl-CoA C-acyltransferase [Sandaracinus sp.]
MSTSKKSARRGDDAKNEPTTADAKTATDETSVEASEPKRSKKAHETLAGDEGPKRAKKERKGDEAPKLSKKERKTLAGEEAPKLSKKERKTLAGEEAPKLSKKERKTLAGEEEAVPKKAADAAPKKTEPPSKPSARASSAGQVAAEEEGAERRPSARAKEARTPRRGSGPKRVSKVGDPGRRAVIVAGVRTPFTKAFGALLPLDTIGLADAAVSALLERTGLPRREIESVVWGGVILPSGAPNVARELALDLRLGAGVEGMTVTRACASGLQAVTLAAAAIERGEADVVLAGGSDSTSHAEVKLPQKAVHALAPLAFGKAKGWRDYLGVASQLMPITEVLPKMPKIAERTTGEVMGEAAERMATRNRIAREAQDAFAARSHHRAAAAIASGRFDREVAPVTLPDGERVVVDDLVRADTDAARLAKLRPVFAKDGTITAGNASPLTDGASAVLLMSEAKAKALGFTPLAAFRSWSYVGVDPADQLLIGPALAMPKALARAGMELSDIDLVDLHEAFAAQVLSVTQALGSDAFARERLGCDRAVGEIDEDRLNVHGGSIAIGHPFGATGARMVTTMANELVTRDLETAILGLCAAGGLGAAAILERV